MKKLIPAIAIALFTAGANADDVYGSLGKGNPDLQEPHADQAVGIRPGVVSSATGSSRSGGRGSALSPAGYASGVDNRSASKTPSIYGGFCGGNPDLNC